MKRPAPSATLPLPFAHKLFPLCNGRASSPPRGSRRMARIQSEFLSAFHQVNLAYARLLKYRARPGHTAAGERPFLRAIEKAIIRKESLDDRYASVGMVAIPVYRDGFAIDVLFHHARSSSPPYLRAGSSGSRSISFPMPPGYRPRC